MSSDPDLSSLDGVHSASSARAAALAAARTADEDPELIQLSLRGLPVYPPLLTPVSQLQPLQPEAAFIVAGGPPCLLREVCLPPYPHPEAPPQLYEAIDHSRRLQSRSLFKASLRELQLVLAVWKKKHLWKILRESPEMSLQGGLAEDVARGEQRALRAVYKQEQRLRMEEEEREFARKMAEKGGDDADQSETAQLVAAAAEQKAKEDAAAAAAAGGDSDGSDFSDEDEEDEDEFGDEEDDEADEFTSAEERRRARRRKRKAAAAAAAREEKERNDAHNANKKNPLDGPEEILEFPAVTPEEELEFLTFFYNTMGSIYQSAAAAATAGQAVHAPGGDGSGQVRWGRLLVVPDTANSPAIVSMLEGTKAGAVAASTHAALAMAAAAVNPPPYATNLGTAFIGEEEPFDSNDSSSVSDEQYIATSPNDLSNSSDARALIALWQAKRAHDFYVRLIENNKVKQAAELREKELAARGGKDEASNANDMDNLLDDHGDGSSDGAKGADKAAAAAAAQSNAANTTLGYNQFAALNIPNLSLAQLASESKAMGLFGFPHINNIGGAAGGAGATASATLLPAAASAASAGQHPSQSIQERDTNYLFWSTQPIIAPQPLNLKGGSGGGGGAHNDSNKSLLIGGGGGAGAALANLTAAASAASAANASLTQSQKLINPYLLCSSADAVTYSNLGTCLYHLGNYPLSLRCFHTSLQIRIATISPADDEYIDVAISLNNVGVTLFALQLFQDAWTFFSAAEQLALQRLDPVHPRLNLIQQNLAKISTRRKGVRSAPELLALLRSIAEKKELKEWEAREKRNAKANKKGAKGKDGSRSGANTSKSGRPGAKKPGGKKGEEAPKEFHEDPRFFQAPLDGQPPIIPKKDLAALEEAEAAGLPPPPLPPLGTAARQIKQMPLRQWDVQMGEFQALLLQFGPAPKKAGKAGGKKKSKKK